ncbi:MAG: hypothetical protein WA751_00655, partial [Candidatus Dormiibacterota bacterium]
MVLATVSGGGLSQDEGPESRFEPLPSQVLLADNLDVMRSLPDACLDLVYIDPPFGTGRVRRLDSIRTGRGGE